MDLRSGFLHLVKPLAELAPVISCYLPPRPVNLRHFAGHPVRVQCALRFAAQRRFEQTIPNEQSTVGEHIKARRIQLRLNWERNMGTPLPRQMPAIIRFLGYVPFKHDDSLGGKLRWMRIASGWTQDEWGQVAKISPGTIGRWEEGRGMRGSPFIKGALNVLAKHLVATGLKNLVSAELRALADTDFRRRQNP